MRILLTAMRCLKGDVAGKLARHRELLALGRILDIDLVLAPEMSLTGYLASEAVTLEDPAVGALVEATLDSPAICFGIAEVAAGKPYISQVVAARGAIDVIHRKAHLGEDEHDAFQPGVPAGVFEVAGAPCSIAICAEIGSPASYALPSRVVLGPAAPGLYPPRHATEADWQRGVDWWRGSTTGDAARLLGRDQVLAVSTQAGATNDEDLAGWAGLIASDGTVLAGLPDWHEGTLVVEVSAAER